MAECSPRTPRAWATTADLQAGRFRMALAEPWQLAMRRPIGQFCADEGWLHRVPVPAPNGGSARGYRELSTPIAIPVTVG
jgi:hypothetical protein